MSFSTPYGPRYEYLCTEGHGSSARREMKHCPVYQYGKPCPGKMRPVGKTKGHPTERTQNER